MRKTDASRPKIRSAWRHQAGSARSEWVHLIRHAYMLWFSWLESWWGIQTKKKGKVMRRCTLNTRGLGYPAVNQDLNHYCYRHSKLVPCDSHPTKIQDHWLPIQPSRYHTQVSLNILGHPKHNGTSGCCGCSCQSTGSITASKRNSILGWGVIRWRIHPVSNIHTLWILCFKNV